MTDNTIVFKIWDITKKKNNVSDQDNIIIEFVSDYMKVISVQKSLVIEVCGRKFKNRKR